LNTRVKVCGITNLEDALMACDAGADALGFNFHPQSPRYLAPAEAAKIAKHVPPFVACVGVFVNIEEPNEVDRMAKLAGVGVLQLHGNEMPSYSRILCEHWKVIKALHMSGTGALNFEYPAHAILLDTADSGVYGGTGRAFDWDLCRRLQTGRTLILAGGLNAGNVALAIRTVQPYAVDVCSGVESGPGEKDALKLAEFMREVRNADQ
jgi:phosphoribosylanthranilate isomerase